VKHDHREQHGNDGLGGEHRGADTRRRLLLKGAHLGERGERRRGRRGHGERAASGKRAGQQALAHQLGGYRRQREAYARSEGGERAPCRSDKPRHHGENGQRRQRHLGFTVAGPRCARLLRRSARCNQRHADHEREHRGYLHEADLLAEAPMARPQQQHQPEREHRLDDRQRRERQGERVERPAGAHERGRDKPAGAAHEPREQCRAQRQPRRLAPRLGCLQDCTGVVEKRGERSEEHTLDLVHGRARA